MSYIQKRLETVIENFGLDNELVLQLSRLRDKEIAKEQKIMYKQYKNKKTSTYNK